MFDNDFIHVCSPMLGVAAPVGPNSDGNRKLCSLRSGLQVPEKISEYTDFIESLTN